MTAPAHQPNDPRRAGQFASRKLIFGEFNRYAVAAIHGRFEAVSWFVFDAETPDPAFPGNVPSIIRQESTFESAVAGLDR